MLALGWVLVPVAGRRFAWWLYPASGRTGRVTLVGVAVVIALYGLSLTDDPTQDGLVFGSVEIPPGGFLVVVADGQPEQGGNEQPRRSS